MKKFGTAIILLILQSSYGVPAQSPASCRGRIVFDTVFDLTGGGSAEDPVTPDVWAIRIDGTGIRQLTFARPGEFSRLANLSPDGQRIVFQGKREVEGDGLFVMMCVTGQLARVTAAGTARPSGPTWSPDGQQIAFVQEGAIFVTRADGSNVRKIEGLPTPSSGPAWSPDGQQIAFTSMGDLTWEIFAVDLGSGHVRQLTHTTEPRTSSQAPEWSPDGSKIAFDRTRDGNFDIYVMNSDGTGIVQLTHDPGDAARPAWSPDGRSIVFHSTGDHRFAGPADFRFLEIYTMRADGSNLRRLTFNQHFDAHPDW